MVDITIPCYCFTLINFNRINGLVSSIMCVTLMSGLLENVIMGSYQMTMFKGF